MRDFIKDLQTQIIGQVTGYLKNGRWYIRVQQRRAITDDPIWITQMGADPPIPSRPLRTIDLDIDIEVHGYWADTSLTVRLINRKLEQQYEEKLNALWDNR